jgi:hypothetical protein
MYLKRYRKLHSVLHFLSHPTPLSPQCKPVVVCPSGCPGFRQKRTARRVGFVIKIIPSHYPFSPYPRNSTLSFNFLKLGTSHLFLLECTKCIAMECSYPFLTKILAIQRKMSIDDNKTRNTKISYKMAIAENLKNKFVCFWLLLCGWGE